MRRHFHSAMVAICAATLCVLVLVGTHTAQSNRAKRLILKDGSYQTATKWEVKGDRVRYLSAERFEWEELPKNLVDWPATEKFNSAADKPDLNVKAVTEEAEREHKQQEEASPEVAAGLRLPSAGGVFLLDTFSNSPQLAELVQTGSEINKQTSRNVLRAAINPLATAKQSIEIPGNRSKVQSHVTIPAIYLNVDQSDSGDDAGNKKPDLDQSGDRYRIVRMDVKKNSRVVGNLKISMIGTVKEQETYVATRLEPMAGGWVKLMPQNPLPTGEYAVVEILGPKQMNIYVWDFGVNPAAPANPTAWKPEPVKDTRTGTARSPVLEGRPK